MKSKNYFFAVDLGATSGRTIIGSIENGSLTLEEVTRFHNHLIEQGGHFYWDIHALFLEMINGLREVVRRNIKITSIGIDAWGVDFVMIGDDDAILRNPRAYRDPITFNAMNDYLRQVISKREIYDITGIQLMNFNTLFQLYAMRQERNSALNSAKEILFMPDALSWMLTGKKVCEYSIASTSQLLNPRTKQFDERLLDSLALTRNTFGKMVAPGTVIGTLTEEAQRLTGLGPVPVIAVAGHDTGSAVAAVPAKNEQFAYLSSGTWSLMGIETKAPIINDLSYERNFTNEGGIEGTTRFLKNICGMWLYECCRKEWPDAVRNLSHTELQGSAMKAEAFRSLIDPDDVMFANPTSMIEAIQSYCRQTGQPIPETPAEICRCIFDSLALRYRQVFLWLREFANQKSTADGHKSEIIDVLHIIGGGSQNKYLNQFTANAIGTTVLAGPQEGTAIGNIMLQAKTAGLVKDIWEMRQIIAHSIEVVRFEPTDKNIWNLAYDKYLRVTKR